MDIEIFKTLWGAVGDGARYPTFREAIPVIADAGFDGVAFALISLDFEPDVGSVEDLAGLTEAHGLAVATMIHTFGDRVDDHLDELDAKLTTVAPLRSRHIICHGGMDHYSDEEAIRFFNGAAELGERHGVTVAHETHRHRILYNPWTTARMLDALPDLPLVVDLSHWVVVAERLIDDQMEIIRRAGRNAIHIDARVGYAEGPQVPDPRDPRWTEELETHIRWWKIIWTEQANAGLPSTVVVPEFGPPPYQQTLPYTGEPTADLWDICEWMAERIREEFADWQR